MKNAFDRRRFKVTRFLVVFLAAGTAGAQEKDVDDAASRAERLMKLIEAQAGDDKASSPSVLGDVDLRSAPAEVRKIARVLREKRVEFMLEKQTVDATIEILRDLSGLNFVVSAKARQALDETKPEVTMTLHELPLENCLNLIALHLRDYRFIIRYGAVILVRAEEYKPRRILRIYEVGDIVHPLPDFPAPALGLGIPEK